jgi:hypothetical protein
MFRKCARLREETVMDRNTRFSHFTLALAGMVLCAGSLQAQRVERLPRPYAVTSNAHGTDPMPDTPSAQSGTPSAPDRPIAGIRTEYLEVAGEGRGEAGKREGPPQLLPVHEAPRPATNAVHILVQGEQPQPAEPGVEMELNVERMLLEAQQGPQIGPPTEAGPEAAELDIDALLEQAEQRRERPAPELGAGLGARLSAYNPNISVIGDFAGVVSSADEDWTGTGTPIRAEGFEEGNADGFEIREMELLMTAAIDPYAEGMLKLAFPEEGVEIEEAYALFHDVPFRDRLPQWLRDVQTKVGVFRMGFGPLNLVDCHDLPTVDRPLPIQQFLGPEGLIRAGVSMSKVIPIRDPWGSELTLEFVNGEPPGDLPGTPPFRGLDQPLGLVHYSVFRESEPVGGAADYLEAGYCPRPRWGYRILELGTTFTATGSRAPLGNEDLYSFMQGFDFTWQWIDPRPDSYRQYLLQGEVFVGELDQPGNGVHGDVGGYLLWQTRLDRRWFAGLRGDFTEFPEEDGYQAAGTPYVTYFFTEFNRARVQYQYLRQEIEGEGTEEAHTAWFQLVFAFGAHPPEPYYITQRF